MNGAPVAFVVGHHRPGAIDGVTLESLDEALAPWGPATSIVERAGLTMLATAPVEDLGDGRLVVADIRLDRPGELRRRLRHSGALPGLTGRADKEEAHPGRHAEAPLAADALVAWPRGAPEEMSGDFAIVVWDAPKRRLTAARDAFGVRPLYYAELEDSVWLSNLPAPILEVSSADATLDDLGVLDFLLFDSYQEPRGTVWRSLQRLPPGRRRWWSEGQVGEDEWAPRPEPVAFTFSSPEEVGREVRRRLDEATASRLPESGRVSVWMSGGLDSTSVAASAQALGSRPIAHTVAYDRLFEDPEGPTSALAAAHIGLEHRRHHVDDYRLYERWEDLPASVLPLDPASDAIYEDIDRECVAGGAVTLTGFGGDPCLLPDRLWWRRSLRRDGILGTAELGWRSWRMTGRRPPLGLAGAVARRALRRRWRDGFPSWLHPDFIRRTDALERWRHHIAEVTAPLPGHGKRTEARQAAFAPGWSHLFERLDAGLRGVRLVRRHPFFDHRLMALLLGLDSMPWCLDKWALRSAAEGRLPTAVLRRPKTALAGDPWPGLVRPLPELWRTWSAGAPGLGKFLDIDKIRRALDSPQPPRALHSRFSQALAFACWRCRLHLR